MNRVGFPSRRLTRRVKCTEGVEVMVVGVMVVGVMVVVVEAMAVVGMVSVVVGTDVVVS